MKGNSSPGIAEKNKSNLPLINTDDTDLKSKTFTAEARRKSPSSSLVFSVLSRSVLSVFISGKIFSRFSYQNVKLTLSSHTEYGVPIRLASD